jgi:hypothetical protein
MVKLREHLKFEKKLWKIELEAQINARVISVEIFHFLKKKLLCLKVAK